MKVYRMIKVYEPKHEPPKGDRSWKVLTDFYTVDKKTDKRVRLTRLHLTRRSNDSSYPPSFVTVSLFPRLRTDTNKKGI